MLLVIPLEKSHRYIRRRMSNGRWVYEYPHGTDSSGRRRVGEKLELALKSPVVDTIRPLRNPTAEAIRRQFDRLEELSRLGKLRVRAWGNCPVVINRKSRAHLFSTKGNPRIEEKVLKRAALLPFIPEILNRTGVLGEKSRRKEGVVFGILGRCLVDGEVKTVEVSLAFDKQKRLFFLSGYEIEKALSLTAITENESLGQFDNALPFINILDDLAPVKSYAQRVREILQ